MFKKLTMSYHKLIQEKTNKIVEIGKQGFSFFITLNFILGLISSLLITLTTRNILLIWLGTIGILGLNNFIMSKFSLIPGMKQKNNLEKELIEMLKDKEIRSHLIYEINQYQLTSLQKEQFTKELINLLASHQLQSRQSSIDQIVTLFEDVEDQEKKNKFIEDKDKKEIRNDIEKEYQLFLTKNHLNEQELEQEKTELKQFL